MTVEDKPVRYYECHVTLYNVSNPYTAIEIGHQAGFKFSDLTKENSLTEKEFILTGKAATYAIVLEKLDKLKPALRAVGFSIYREKIEAIIHDSKATH